MTVSSPLLPVIAHFYHAHLPKTHTFVYECLTHHRRYRPIVLAAERVNVGEFPLAGIFTPPGSRVTRLFASASRRLLQRQLPYERFFVRALRENSARVLHAHFGDYGVHALPLHRATHIPLVTTFYGGDMSALARASRWRRAYVRLFRAASLILAEGPHMRGRLVDLGCPAERVVVHHIGIDLEKFPFAPRQLAPDEDPRILMTGRMVEKKGFEYGIRAFAQVSHSFPRAGLRLIGDGPLRCRLEHVVRKVGLESRVAFLGMTSYATYAAEVAAAHLILVPSVTAESGDSEGGAPTVLLEAQATGAPVITTRHADIPEVVARQNHDLLVPERDAGALAHILAGLLAHPQRWHPIARAGRAHIEAAHEIRSLAEALEAHYDRLIAGHSIGLARGGAASLD